MQTRVCYIHLGPYKTGTTSMVFVSWSETKRGAHHALAEKLVGLETKRRTGAARFQESKSRTNV